MDYNITKQTLIFNFIHPEILITVAFLFFILSVTLVIIIYTNIYIKKRYFLLKIIIQKRMNNWLAEQIAATNETSNELPDKIKNILKSNYAKKIITDELIALKNNIRGKEAEKINRLYEILQLKDSSIKKLYSKKWYVKAKGIHELYTMDQRDLLKVIYKNANSTNELVRTEAQTGIVHMYGFDGLRFLSVVSNPITEWQQIKLLAQLENQHPDNVFYKKLNNWLQSKNDTVITFCLKITAIYKIEEVLPIIHQSCLNHNNAIVRKTAIETLVSFHPKQIDISALKTLYKLETKKNKIAILTVLQKIGSKEDIEFLKGIVLTEDIDIAKEAMTTLLKIEPSMITWNEQLFIQKNKVMHCTLHALDELAYQ